MYSPVRGLYCATASEGPDFGAPAEPRNALGARARHRSVAPASVGNGAGGGTSPAPGGGSVGSVIGCDGAGSGLMSGSGGTGVACGGVTGGVTYSGWPGSSGGVVP